MIVMKINKCYNYKDRGMYKVMEEQSSYEKELNKTKKKIEKSFNIKINTISSLQTSYYLKKLVELNENTKNKNIEELIKTIGEVKQKYKKYCDKNNYYTDPYVNKKITEAYSKLSLKNLKLQTKRSNIKNDGLKMLIKYNSNKGKYEISYYEHGRKTKTINYNIKNITNLAYKRQVILNELKRQNYGINVFKELKVDEEKIYKLNPDIIRIFLKEGKMDYAKMYIREVLDGNSIYKPFKIKYELNRNLKTGKFTEIENKNMKKMARADRISNELVIFDNKRRKVIQKPKNTIIQGIEKFIETQRSHKQQKIYNSISLDKNNNLINKINVFKQNLKESGKNVNKNSYIAETSAINMQNNIDINSSDKIR